MNERARRTEVLRAAAQRKRDDALRRAETAIRQLVKDGRAVTFKAVAEQAPCSTAFLYGHPDLRRRIAHLRDHHRPSAPIPAPNPDAPSSVVRTLTLQIADLRRRNREETAQMQQDLAAAHGEILHLRRRLNGRGD
jgi:Family of unknown function (DUF6262)